MQKNSVVCSFVVKIQQYSKRQDAGNNGGLKFVTRI
jgi:hypothetical protein